MNFYFSVVPASKESCFTGNIYNNDLELTGSHGTLQSPQEPDWYLTGGCDWLITVPDGKIVKLSFNRFKLQPSPESICTADYVEVLDGSHSNSESKGRFCGDSYPDDIHSSGPNMWVRFRADTMSDSYSGFSATFTAEDKPSTGKYRVNKPSTGKYWLLASYSIIWIT